MAQLLHQNITKAQQCMKEICWCKKNWAQVRTGWFRLLENEIL
jgi:hypothetical protein